MALQLYNTMARKKQTFEPREPGKVGMYVCGVTAYDLSHIGHARVYVAFDAIYRYLRLLGYDVTYVRNFTDVDDKIIKRANEHGEEPLALSARYIDEFHRDMDMLGVLRPEVEPKVSTHMDEIIGMVQRIIDHGHAYIMDGDVFFSIDTAPEYGKLSGRNLEDLRAGERVAVDPRKKNPFDFALWKAAKPGEPTWDSPWGPGRPGWHIECSAMSTSHLGPAFDIHAGGKDLVFPHHENEVAQSEAANEKPCARYWLHNGFVNVDAEKMSKSLGNFFTVRDVLEVYHPQAIRWFLLSTHYRAPINYTEHNLEEASDRVYYLYQTLVDIDQAVAAPAADVDGGPLVEAGMLDALQRRFGESMDDDFNTPQVMGVIAKPLKLANELLHTKKGRKRRGRLTTLTRIREELGPILGVLGVGADVPAQVLGEMKALALRRHELTQADLGRLIAERVQARADRDWARADVIRDDLLARGVLLMDTPDGTDWRPVYELGEGEVSQEGGT